MNNLSGKAALVTGSTSGIGQAMIEALARAGANVVLNGFGDTDEIEAFRQSLESEYGVNAIYHPADMSQPSDIEAMFRDMAGQMGSIDILVNNAGIQHVAPVDEFPLDKWDSIVAINLSACFHTTRLALPAMKSNRWGRIINLASAHGTVASPYKSAYVAAKHGMLGFTKTVALEVAQQGITCNAICPGYVKTPLVEAQIPDSAKTHGISEEAVIRDVMLAGQPTKRFVEPHEIGGFAVFLCSDSAASITGASLPIDGGWVAQ